MKPLLNRLEENERELLLANSREVSVKRGEIIFEEGSVASDLYFIMDGTIRVHKQMKKNKEVTVFLRKADDAFGEIGIFSSEFYSCSAVALTDASLLYISKSDMETLMAQNGRLALQITKWLAESLEASQAKLRDYLVFGSEGAVASIFIRLSNMYGKETDRGIEITEPVVVQDVAKYVGITRETASRVISKWKDQGLIENEAKKFLICDIEYFRSLLMCDLCGVRNCTL
ncbi:Crp/Fnr family transcriptional regulator [Thalassobacillus devorans]|uniref:Crp/Fnr family transcriptional regulator n=1 Tax=Thalassobacillus devorans TaxID=279813 RepID=A0ABQ1PT32_9BACI|nr:Crp/Fnr family transcriptional regulator [Thalassobacillus devorans]NIK30694.1 CRP/FNR family transcriptional regulator [Thalassobacillus devorans]GGD03040.1 Crp/Fnr family transcriptional regulator [Thalassobacillus devorans]